MKRISIVIISLIYATYVMAQESKFEGIWSKTIVSDYYNADVNTYVTLKSIFVLTIKKYGRHYRITGKYVPLDDRKNIDYLPEYTVTDYNDSIIHCFNWHYKLGFSDGTYKDIKTYYHIALLDDGIIKLCGDSIDNKVYDGLGNYLFEEKNQRFYGEDIILYKEAEKQSSLRQ